VVIIAVGFEVLVMVTEDWSIIMVKGGSHRLTSNTGMLIPDCMVSHP
jgi:hypothetical protein